MAPVGVSGGQVRAGPFRAPVIPLILTGIGVYLAWFAVHYWGSDTKWPTDPVKAVLTGKSLPVPTGQVSAAQAAAGIEAATPAANPNAGAEPTPPASGSYSLTQLQALWTESGGDAATAYAAANIAIAESSGNPNVTSANPDGGTNVGLWQLDTLGKGAGYTIAQLQSPSLNAQITILQTANGTNWSGWADSVVSNGVYTGPEES
jgi:hypothetical protein